MMFSAKFSAGSIVEIYLESQSCYHFPNPRFENSPSVAVDSLRFKRKRVHWFDHGTPLADLSSRKTRKERFNAQSTDES